MAIEPYSPSPLSHFDPASLLDVLTTGVVILDSQLCMIYANVGAQDLRTNFRVKNELRRIRRKPGKRWIADHDAVVRRCGGKCSFAVLEALNARCHCLLLLDRLYRFCNTCVDLLAGLDRV